MLILLVLVNTINLSKWLDYSFIIPVFKNQCFLFLLSPGVALTAETKIHRNPSESGVHSMTLALPPSQAK